MTEGWVSGLGNGLAYTVRGGGGQETAVKLTKQLLFEP